MSHRIAARHGDAIATGVLARMVADNYHLGTMPMGRLTEIHPYAICRLQNPV
jgi:hypothetical protein